MSKDELKCSLETKITLDHFVIAVMKRATVFSVQPLSNGVDMIPLFKLKEILEANHNMVTGRGGDHAK